jgi:hypothetical protein
MIAERAIWPRSPALSLFAAAIPMQQISRLLVREVPAIGEKRRDFPM